MTSPSHTLTVATIRAKLVDAENNMHNLTTFIRDLEKYFLDIDDRINDALKQDRERLLQLDQSAREIEKGNKYHFWRMEKLYEASEKCNENIEQLSEQLDSASTKVLSIRAELIKARYES